MSRLKRFWPWIVFPAALFVLNAVLFAMFGQDEEAVRLSTIDVGDAPQYVAVGDGSLWISGVDVRGIDIATEREVVEPVVLPEAPGGLVVAGGYVWVGTGHGSGVYQIDGDNGNIVATVTAGRTPQMLASGFDSVWAAALDEGKLVRIELEGPARPRRLDVGHDFLAGVTTGFGSVWVTDVVDDVVIRVDPSSGEVQDEIPVGTSPTAIATGEGAVWVTNFGDGTLTRIDPDSGTVDGEPLFVGGKPVGVVTGGGLVWVTSLDEDAVSIVNPDRHEVTGRIEVGENPQGIAFGSGSVWIANQEDDTITRLEL
jgi:virginiamycin B lyase